MGGGGVGGGGIESWSCRRLNVRNQLSVLYRLLLILLLDFYDLQMHPFGKISLSLCVLARCLCVLPRSLCLCSLPVPLCASLLACRLAGTDCKNR